MGTVNNPIRVVALEDVEPIELPKDSWSRMVLTDSNIESITSSMGYSIFKPGMVTSFVSHEVEELAFVIAGHGELRLDEGAVPFGPGQAMHIPPHTWHAVAITGEEDVIMVFTFPYPDYPPTERR